MFFWFIGTAVVTVWFVFRDPMFDYRLLIVGSVLPAVVDAFFGGARVLHSLTFSVVLLVVLMLATPARSPIRRTLLGLPVGTLLHLVFTGAWIERRRCSGGRSAAGRSTTPSTRSSSRGWWNVVLEADRARAVLVGGRPCPARAIRTSVASSGAPARLALPTR